MAQYELAKAIQKWNGELNLPQTLTMMEGANSSGTIIPFLKIVNKFNLNQIAMELLALSAIITILLIAYKKEILSGVKKLSVEIKKNKKAKNLQKKLLRSIL